MKEDKEQPIELNRSQFMYGLLKSKFAYSKFEGEEVKKEIAKIDTMAANLEEIEKANQRINFYYQDGVGFYFVYHPKLRAGFITSKGDRV